MRLSRVSSLSKAPSIAMTSAAPTRSTTIMIIFLFAEVVLSRCAAKPAHRPGGGLNAVTRLQAVVLDGPLRAWSCSLAANVIMTATAVAMKTMFIFSPLK